MTSRQAPLPSGFGATTTAREVVGQRDLRDAVAIVTGGSAGIGAETTRTLSEAGATVIVPARNLAKARAAVGELRGVELEAMELGDPASIDAFAGRFLASGRPLHMLIDSAGIMACPLARDARGFESQLAVNHLGHFQLACRLWPALRAARGARVVSVSSRGHRRAGVDFDDPSFERRPYDKWMAYGQSKTANVLFALGLDVRGEPHGVRAFAVHPGGILTELSVHMSPEERRQFNVPDGYVLGSGVPVPGFKSPQQGAATQVWCATSPQLAGLGGVYCEDCDIAAVRTPDDADPNGVRPYAIDPALAERLWTASERWTGAQLQA